RRRVDHRPTGRRGPGRGRPAAQAGGQEPRALAGVRRRRGASPGRDPRLARRAARGPGRQEPPPVRATTRITTSATAAITPRTIHTARFSARLAGWAPAAG